MRPQFFLGLAFVLALLWSQALGALHAQDTQALLSLSASLSGLDWDLVSPCTQQGITCDESSPQRVVALNVAALDLVGTIATHIGRLQALTYLNLGGNFIYNHLPTQIGSLKELRTLDLHDNFFEGALPTEIGKLTQLTILNLGESGFQGFIPTQVGLLSNLVTLDLKSNQFVGTIPTELFGLTQLETLSLLGSNNLCPVADYSGLASGSTDYDEDRAEDCEGCDTIYDTCQNEGECNPQPDGSFTCDCQLGFAGLLCDSSVPTCPQLAADNAVWAPVNAQTAAVVGTCNEGFIGAPTRDCQVGGTWSSSSSGEACVPAPTTDPTDQAALLAFWGGLVAPGQLAWDTAASLCDQQGVTCNEAHKVTSLDLSGLNLAGPIHPKLGDLTALQHLDLSSNTLTGTIPTALGGLAALVTLHLNNNHLVGTIPEELNLPLLESLLVLGTNNLCPIANLSTWDVLTTDYDERPDPCLACATAFDTCANGGACSGNDGELFTCECLPGFGGSYCQDPAPHCEPTEAFGAAWPAAHPASSVNGACLPGYTGAPSLTCQADATWAESVEGTPCTRNRCLEEASHGFASWPETDSLTTAEGTCAPGYSGSPKRECLANGWASEVTSPCTRKTCPYEVSFTQHIIWEQTDSLTTASGTCFNGFEGAPTRDCLADGWDSTVGGISCTLMRCPLDQVTNNATWLSYPSFTYGVAGTCNDGYCGAPIRDCINGVWSSVRGTPCQASKLCSCGPGHFGSVTACTPCPQNTYQDEAAQGTCKNCPPNSGSAPGSTKRSDCSCLPGYQPFGGSCRLITCPAESHQTVTFPVTPGGVTASGTCKIGWVGSPSRQCGVDGQWSFTIQSPCLPVFVPTCRNPLQCGLLSQLNCNRCYHSGGMVDPRFPTLCYCPATIQYSLPSATTCSTPLTLCEGSYLCNTTCLTCNGPAAHQCLTCTDSEGSELVYVGSNNFGYCLPNCPPGTHRHLSQYTCVPLSCSHLNSCSLHGTCVWTGYQSNCTCDPNWGGLDCSIPLSCPQLDNCNNKGNCTLDRTTNSVYCKCLLGSEGPTCAIKQNFTTTNNLMTELGVNFLNITWSSRGFHHGDRVILHWWNKFTKNCTIHPPNAICLAPPHSSMLTAFDIYATINETYYTKVGRALITGSFSLPETYQAWEFMEWKSGVPRLFNYTLLPPYKKGGSTVTVEVYRFQYPADRDYADLSIWPQMKYAGVVYTGPNNGTFTLTLDPNEYKFNYDNATHIMVISSSGFGAHGFYFVPEEPGFNKSHQCEIFRGWRWYMTQAIWKCVTPGTDPIKYIECTALTRFPEITSVWNPCDEGQIYPETCYMWFDFFGRKTYHHLWEPNLFDSFDQEVIMYMASTILPKYMCCPVSNGLDCDRYLTKRQAWEREYPVRKRGVLPITAGSTGLAFGTLHFVSLDGVPFTFNAVGEFILLQDNLGEFVVQIRTTKVPNKAASRITAVVVKGNGSKIGVYLDQFNQFAMTFDDEFQTEDLPISSRDTLLISGDLLIRRLSERALRITARNKVKITIKKDGGALHVQVVVPNNLREVLAPVITGLLGSFDGVPANDLVERHNSSAIVPPSSPTFVYEPFANSWRITPDESLFAYPIGMGHADYNDLSFVPVYPETLPFDPVYSDPATQVCSAAGDFANVCYFDLVLAQSYLPSNTIMEFSRYYNKIRSGNNYGPEFSGMSENPVTLRLGDEYEVSFSVTDIDDSVFSVFVSSSPSPDYVFDPINYKYSFTMTESLFLNRNFKSLTFTAVDELDGVESFLIPFYKKYSTCADGLDKVRTEARIEIDAFCHVTADTCTRDCRITLDRLFGLSCFPEIAREFGSALTATQELCCDDYSIPCPEPNALSQEAVVGVAVGVVLFVVLMVSIVGFLIFKKINSHSQDDPATHEMMALDDKLAL